MKMTFGVISDTHGLLRKEVRHTLLSCDAILHAGDIGSKTVWDDLKNTKPLTGVRGNVDRELWALKLPETELIECGGKTLYVLHNIGDLEIDLKAAGVDILVYGHSHQPSIHYKDGILFLNPGSAGPRRFNLPVSMALLTIEGDTVTPELIPLSDKA